jgi:hypothetical protein
VVLIKNMVVGMQKNGGIKKLKSISVAGCITSRQFMMRTGSLGWHLKVE